MNVTNFRDALIQKWYLQDPPPIQQNGIFETPLQKIAFLRPFYTTKWHFRDPLYEQRHFCDPDTKTGIKLTRQFVAPTKV